MMKMRPDPVWLLPTKSISPMNIVGKVLPSVRVQMLVGNEDNVAPATLTQEYADALRNHGNDVMVTVVPGLTHDILLEPIAFEQLAALVERIGRTD
jgi:predicted esterase